MGAPTGKFNVRWSQRWRRCEEEKAEERDTKEAQRLTVTYGKVPALSDGCNSRTTNVI